MQKFSQAKREGIMSGKILEIPCVDNDLQWYDPTHHPTPGSEPKRRPSFSKASNGEIIRKAEKLRGGSAGHQWP